MALLTDRVLDFALRGNVVALVACGSVLIATLVLSLTDAADPTPRAQRVAAVGPSR